MTLSLKSGAALIAAATAMSLSMPAVFGTIPTPTAPSSTTEWRGYLPNIDAGTAGDIYIAPNGNDANLGTIGSPKLTIDAAAIANPGKVIRVRGGTYRQKLSLPAAASGTAGARTQIRRYGTEQVIVSGREVLSGLTTCSAGDAAVVGAVWNAAGMYKVTVADSVVASTDPASFTPVEAGRMMALAAELIDSPRAPIEPFAMDDWQTWQIITTGDAVASASGQPILGYKNPTITDKYTQAELQAMTVSFYGQPNLSYASSVASFDTTKKILYLTNQGQKVENSAYQNVMALRNVPKNIKQGQWAYVRNGDGTTTYYLWLMNAANAASGVEYSARDCNLIFNDCDYVTVEGIIFEGTASSGTVLNAGDLPVLNMLNAKAKAVGLEFYNCWIRQHYRPYQRLMFALHMNLVDNLLVRQCSVTECFGMYGIHPDGNQSPGSLANMTKGMWIDRCLFENISATSIRIYAQAFGAVTHCVWRTNCGIAPHANKIDPKQYSHFVWVHGCDFSGAGGYITWQHASAFHLTCCYDPGNYISGNSRAVQDQNGAVTNPAGSYGVSGLGYWLNNHFAPDPQDTTRTDEILVGSISNVTFLLDNNILFAAGAGLKSVVTRGSGNIVTQGTPASGETSEAKNTAYENVVIGDFRPKATSSIRSKAGNNRAAEIAAIIAQLPQISGGVQNLDINGDPINWAAPPIGPSVTYVVNTTASHFVNIPALSGGSPTVGQTMTIDNGLYVPAHIGVTYQWWRSADGGRSFSQIGGAQGSSYVVQSGDLGYVLARDTTLNGVTVRTIISSPVISTYPLANPVPAVAVMTSGLNQSLYETAQFDVQDRPLLILYSARIVGSVKSVPTCTIGAPGRVAGIGTVIPNAPTNSDVIRGSAQVGAFFVRSPGVIAAQTVNINIPAGCAAMAIGVFYVDGATGIGVVSGNGLTAMGLTLTKNSTLASSLMAYMAGRHDGTTGLGMTGATVLSEGVAGTSSGDLAYSLGFEIAPAVGPYQSTVSGSKNSSLILGGVEIFS